MWMTLFWFTLENWQRPAPYMPLRVRKEVWVSANQCPVLIEIEPDNRYSAGIRARLRAQPAEVSLALRDRGWRPYRVWFDASAGAWVAAVTYRPDVA
jgi:hypothetical protein